MQEEKTEISELPVPRRNRHRRTGRKNGTVEINEISAQIREVHPRRRISAGIDETAAVSEELHETETIESVKPELSSSDAAEEHLLEEELESDLEKTQQILNMDLIQEDHSIEGVETDTQISGDVLFLKKNTLLDRLFRPVTVMNRINPYAKLSFVPALIRIFLSIGISMIFYLQKAAEILNLEAFSYARLTFTDTSWIWIRLSAFLFAGEILAYIVIAVLCIVLGKRTSLRDILVHQGYAALPSTVLFLIAGYLTRYGFIPGLCAFCAASAFSISLHSSALETASGLSRDKIHFLMIVGSAVAVAVLCIYFSRFDNDLVMIIQALLPRE